MKLPLIILLLSTLLVGCTSKPQEPIASTIPDPYGHLFFRVEYATALNNDAAAISGCTVERIHTGNDRGPICQKACETGVALIAFESAHESYMQSDGYRPSKQHDWCRENKIR